MLPNRKTLELQLINIFKILALFALCPIPLIAEEGSNLIRGKVIQLAAEDSDSSRTELVGILTDRQMLGRLSQGEGGPQRGLEIYSETVDILSQSSQEATFNILVELLNADLTQQSSSLFLPVLDAVIDSKGGNEELVLSAIQGVIIPSKTEMDQAIAEYPFLEDNTVKRKEVGEYYDASGKMIHRGPIFSRMAPRAAMKLIDINSSESWKLLEQYYQGYLGADMPLFVDSISAFDMRKHRYDGGPLSVYDALISNEYFSDEIRLKVIEDLFTDNQRFKNDPQAAPPYQSIEKADLDSLKNLISLTDYVLEQDFLTNEVRATVEKRREFLRGFVSSKTAKEIHQNTDASRSKDILASERQAIEESEAETERTENTPPSMVYWGLGATVLLLLLFSFLFRQLKKK